MKDEIGWKEAKRGRGGKSAGWPEDHFIEIFNFTLEQSCLQTLLRLPGSPPVCRCRRGSAADAPVGSGTAGGCAGRGVPSLLGSVPSQHLGEAVSLRYPSVEQETRAKCCSAGSCVSRVHPCPAWGELADAPVAAPSLARLPSPERQESRALKPGTCVYIPLSRSK